MTIKRTLPTVTDNVTYETIHPSVLQQHKLLSYVSDDLKQHASLVGSLSALEERVKSEWAFPRPGHPADSAPNPTNQSQKRLSLESSVEIVKTTKVTEIDGNGYAIAGTVHTESVHKTAVAHAVV